MKKNVLLILTVLILATLACNLVSSPGGDAEAPPDSAESGDPETSPSDPVPEAPVVDQGAGAGPESIDLSSPDLNGKDRYPAYRENTELNYDGVDPSGNPKTTSMIIKIENQTSPKSRYVSMTGSDASEGSIEMVTFEDQTMSVYPGVGCTIFPASAMEGQEPDEEFLDFNGTFTGQANRMETGITIEGVVTDRYELKSENITESESDNYPESFEGSVYIARDGGYIVRIEMEGTDQGEESFGFDPNAETQVRVSYTFIPVDDGSLVITPPAGCADQLAGANDYPVIDGASDPISMGSSLFYTVNTSLEEVLNFYRTEMVADGWTLTKDVGGGSISFATLEFTKDGETVEVGAIQNGDEVAVTVEKK